MSTRIDAFVTETIGDRIYDRYHVMEYPSHSVVYLVGERKGSEPVVVRVETTDGLVERKREHMPLDVARLIHSDFAAVSRN